MTDLYARGIMVRAMMKETQRDVFAGQALQGLLSCDSPGQLMQRPAKDTAKCYADAAYAYADAMLKSRGKV